MGQRQYIEFNCDDPNCRETYTVDLEEKGDTVEGWPQGWLIVKTKALEHSLPITKIYCTVHRESVLQALNFDSYKSYNFVVKEKVLQDRLKFEKVVKPDLESTLGISLGDDTEDSEPN